MEKVHLKLEIESINDRLLWDITETGHEETQRYAV